MTNNILMGTTVNTENNNRGCLALGIGAIILLAKKYNQDSYTILNIAKETSKNVEVKEYNGKKYKIITQNIASKYYKTSLVDIWMYLLTKKTNNDLIKFLSTVDNIYNINWGDGFTDIYGFNRVKLFLVECLIPILMNKNMIFMPQTIGPFKTFWGKIISFIILKFCKKVYVRDSMAEKYLKTIGVKYERSYDVSVYMQPEKEDFEPNDKTIGINISGLLHFKTDLSDTSEFEQYDELVEKLIRKFISMNKNVLLIPHTYNAENPERADDLVACKYFAAKINSDKIHIVDKNYTAPQLKYIISKCEFFIGSRMHSNFAALSTSTPCVGLGYSYKFKGGFEMFGIPECAISLKNFEDKDADNIVSKIIELYNNRDAIKQKLTDINNSRGALEL